MEHIIKELYEEYKTTMKKIKEDPFVGNGIINFNDVIRAHYLIGDFFINEGERIICGVKSVSILGSTLGRQMTSSVSRVKWKKPEEVCATLFFGLIKNHPFHDANKRTAILTLLLHLHKIGKTITASQKEFEELALDIASDGLRLRKKYQKFDTQDDPEVRFIADFLHRNTREIDKRYYPITYQELNRLLKHYDCSLENPHDNYIDVVKNVEEIKFFKKQKVPKKLLNIGFPGWKRQMNLKALKEVLKATGLTAENGIDSKVFFKDADPLAAFIDEYKSLLWRLRNK